MQILTHVCQFYGIDQVKVLAGGKSRIYVIIRRITFVLCRELTVHSLVNIGTELGFDHSSLVHALAKHRRELQSDPIYARDFRLIAAPLRERLRAA